MASKVKVILLFLGILISYSLFANVVVEIKTEKLGERGHQLRRTIISEMMKHKVPFTFGATQNHPKQFLHIEIIGGNPTSLKIESLIGKGEVKLLKTTVEPIELNNRVVHEIRKALSRIKE